MSRLTLSRPRLRLTEQRIAKPREKQAEPFYQSKEWQDLRDLIIIRDRNTCQWPGCGRKERRMFVDHKIELKDGGNALDPVNCWTLCGSHHTKKTNAERQKRLLNKTVLKQ